MTLLLLLLCALVVLFVISEHTVLHTLKLPVSFISTHNTQSQTSTPQEAKHDTQACGTTHAKPTTTLVAQAVDPDERPPDVDVDIGLPASSLPLSLSGSSNSSSPSPSPSASRLLHWPELSEAPPALQLYLKYHSRRALQSVLWSPLVCSHRVIIVSCGSGNYGTTVIRLLAALKVGIMTNTTVAIAEAPLYMSILYLSSWRSFEVGRSRMGCPIHHLPEKTQLITLDNPPHGQLFWTLTHNWKQHNCTNIHYPGDSAAARSDTERRWADYYRLRCSDVYAPGTGLLSGQYLRFSFGDQWQALQLLEQNPYYRALNGFVGPGIGLAMEKAKAMVTDGAHINISFPTVRPYIPDDEPEMVMLIAELQKKHDFSHAQHRKSLAHYRSCVVCGLFRSMFRVDSDVARVIERLSGSRPFDYYFHIRSVKGGAVTDLQPTIIRQLQQQWAAWNRTHTRTVSGVSVPVPHPSRRMYILLDYGNQTETCTRFQEAFPWLSCHYFRVSDWLSSFLGWLPVSLSPVFVADAAVGQGWGLAPLWAAVVDMYAVYGAEYGWTHVGSAYGRLVGWNAKDCQPHRVRNYNGENISPSPYQEF